MPAPVTYTVTDGELVRRFHGVPEDAWPLNEAPRGDMIAALLSWTDPNGNFGTLTDDELRGLLAEWEQQQ